MRNIREFIRELRHDFCQYALTHDKVVGMRILNRLTALDEAHDIKGIVVPDTDITVYPTTEEIRLVQAGEKMPFLKRLRETYQLDLATCVQVIKQVMDIRLSL